MPAKIGRHGEANRTRADDENIRHVATPSFEREHAHAAASWSTLGGVRDNIRAFKTRTPTCRGWTVTRQAV
jgi:hypothetical protein